jgi:hypothetical protein
MGDAMTPPAGVRAMPEPNPVGRPPAICVRLSALSAWLFFINYFSCTMLWSLGHFVIHGRIASNKVCRIKPLSMDDGYDPELASMDAQLSSMPGNSMQRPHGLRTAATGLVSR